MRLLPFFLTVVTVLVLFCPGASAMVTSGNNTITIIDSQSQPNNLQYVSVDEKTPAANTPYSFTADTGTVIIPYVWIKEGQSFNFTVISGGNSIPGYVNFEITGPLSANLYTCIGSEVQVHEQNYIWQGLADNWRRIEIAYAMDLTTKQHYLIVLDDSNYGAGVNVTDLHYMGITGFTTSNVVGELKYQTQVFQVEDYYTSVDDGQSMVNGDLYNEIMQYFDLIGALIGTLIATLLILKVIFIDNFFMVIGFGELGILVISLRQNPKDIFGFVNDVIQYNVRLITFIVNLLIGFINGFQMFIQILYNVAKSIPIIGQFL